eukprot:1295401-Lingulodinium_polyedra.AAC.1
MATYCDETRAAGTRERNIHAQVQANHARAPTRWQTQRVPMYVRGACRVSVHVSVAVYVRVAC